MPGQDQRPSGRVNSRSRNDAMIVAKARAIPGRARAAGEEGVAGEQAASSRGSRPSRGCARGCGSPGGPLRRSGPHRRRPAGGFPRARPPACRPGAGRAGRRGRAARRGPRRRGRGGRGLRGWLAPTGRRPPPGSPPASSAGSMSTARPCPGAGSHVGVVLQRPDHGRRHCQGAVIGQPALGHGPPRGRREGSGRRAPGSGSGGAGRQARQVLDGRIELLDGEPADSSAPPLCPRG